MASPSVVGTIAKGGTTAVGNLVLTTSAAAAVGDFVVVAVGQGAVSTISVTDSKGNTYTSLPGRASSAAGGYALVACYVSAAIAISDTITVTGSVGVELCAVAVRLTGVSSSMAAADRGGTTVALGSSTAPQPTSLTLGFSDDTIYLCICAFSANAVADFSSIGSSYTIADTAASTSGAADCSVALAYRAVSAATPMVATQPTWTLANSRTWRTATSALSGLTDRGAVAKDISLDRLTSPAQQIAQPYSQDELEAVAGVGVSRQGGGISILTRPA